MYILLLRRIRWQNYSAREYYTRLNSVNERLYICYRVYENMRRRVEQNAGVLFYYKMIDRLAVAIRVSCWCIYSIPLAHHTHAQIPHTGDVCAQVRVRRGMKHLII